MEENIVLSKQLQMLISAGNHEEAKKSIYKNFSSDKKPFRNIDFLKDHLPKKLDIDSSIEIGINRRWRIILSLLLTLLIAMEIILWISPEYKLDPWVLYIFIPCLLIVVAPLFNRKFKLKIDDSFFTLNHEQEFRIELDSILTGYIHSVSNFRDLAKPDYYLTIISKDLVRSKQVNISDLELSGWEIGALLGYKILNNKAE